jgi:hypothetical protein
MARGLRGTVPERCRAGLEETAQMLYISQQNMPQRRARHRRVPR